MAKVNLSTMDIESLTDLRKRIDQRLLECRADLEKQLEDWTVLLATKRLASAG